MGHPLPFASSFRISLVSCTLNYAMTIGGLSGVAAKVYLLAKEQISPSNTLSISMVHGFLTNTVAVIFIYLGFFFLYSEYKLSTREKEVGFVILLIAFLLSWITIQTIIHESFRKKLWQLCLRLALFVCHKIHRPHWVHQEKAQAFFENFNESLNIIMKNSSILLAPAMYALFDWALMFFCLKCSFLAIRYPVDNMTLLVGFSVGIFMTPVFSDPCFHRSDGRFHGRLLLLHGTGLRSRSPGHVDLSVCLLLPADYGKPLLLQAVFRVDAAGDAN